MTRARITTTLAGLGMFIGAIGAAADDGPPGSREEFARHVAPLLEDHCLKCHGPERKKGGITLHDLPVEPATAEQVELWEKVLEALESGDMPPDDQKQPTADQRSAVVAWVSAGLARMQRSAPPAPTVATMRRMTNFEYENTLRDLLGLDLNVRDDLPEDPIRPYHFNNTPAFMLLGPEQIDRYLDCARRVLASTIVDPTPPQVVRKRMEWKADSTDPKSLAQNEVGIWGNRRGSAAMGFAVENPPTTGEFRLRFKASARLAAGAQEVPLRFVMGYGLDVNSSTLRIAPVGTVRLRNGPDAPREFELRGRLENFPVEPATTHKGRTVPPRLHITPQNLYDDGTLNDNNNFQKTRNAEMPRVVLEWAEFEGPLAADWPPEHHRRILFDSPLRERDPDAYIRAVLERFLPRAFRRPATPEEVSRFAAIFGLVRPASPSFEAAVRETFATVLISPQFLYHTVADGRVVPPQFELASRLSCFLWGSMPDDELTGLAAAGRLTDPKVMEDQVLRLLGDSRSSDFVSNFTTQWLSLAKARTVPINAELFPRFLYYVPFGERKGTEEPYRPTVRDNMIDETLAFVAELIRRNASALSIVDSDFAMLNQRLAVHYGVPDVHGDELRAVPLKLEHQLGGLLTHGSVLIGNGTGSAPHPIYRAVWLREAILGEKVPPPPAEVPALADSAGASAEKALSIKELLLKHRQLEDCNSCHARLDPWGIPFEQYNAIGRFQPMVPKEGTRVRGFQPQLDRSPADYLAYLNSICTVPVEADARLPGGTVVDGMRQLKAHLLKQRADDIAGNMIRRLLTYAMGRELTLRDRADVASLVAATRPGGWGMRDIIVEICRSRTFHASAATPDSTN